MAQLPTADSEATVPLTPQSEPDPDTTGTVLSRFYGGVRRAEAEDEVTTSAAPAGPRTEEEQ
jgi:hypothetical protein